MVRRRTAGVLGCLVAVVTLAGCAEKHEAAQTLPPTTSAPHSSVAALPALGPADFPVPKEARQRTPAGVQAFTRYYVALMNRQARTLDSQPLRELSRQCQTCNALANTYDESKAAGYRYEGGSMSLVDSGSALIRGNDAQTSFVLKQSAITVRDRTGAEVAGRSFPATRYTGGAILEWDSQQTTWLITQFDADPM
jgi:hypothetical protein